MVVFGREVRRGLTLSEIIFALGVMSAITLAVVGVFTKLLVASTKSSDLTTANLLARSILEKAVRSGPENGWGNGGNYSVVGGTASRYTHSDDHKTDFVYQIIPTRLTSDTDDVGGVLYDVKVIVTWWKDSADAEATRQEFGKTATQISRTVYIRR